MNSAPRHYAPQKPKEKVGAETYVSAAKRPVSVQEGYERWAPTYDLDPNPLLALEERQLRCMLPALQGKRVLDLACGTGRWLAWILGQEANSAVGIDSSPAMLAAARQKPGLAGRLLAADCGVLPFPDRAFDLVLCAFAISHIVDVERVAREVARVTAPNGDVYVSDLHPQAHAQGWRTGFRDDQGSVEIATWPHSVRELLATWMSSGFECVQSVECRFTEMERPIFRRAGKAHLFAEVCHVPAVQVFHFQLRPEPRMTGEPEGTDGQLEHAL